MKLGESFTLRESSLAAKDLQEASEVDLAVEQRYIEILKRRRNAISRINRALPPELLAEIFQHYIGSMCPEDHKPLHDRHQALRKPYAWIRISHVCRSWREVAIASPRIWSRIVITNDTNDECIQEMLLRSQQAPLVVKVHAKINTLPTLRSVRAVLAEIHRICSMDLRLFGISLFNLTQSIECNLDAPLLREFSMSDGPNTSRLSRETTPLLTGTIHLERQVLSGYNIEQIRHSIYPSIRHLSLSLSPPFAAELLQAALQETTLLETLRLRLPGYPSTQTIDTAPTEILALPHLKRLELRGGATVCSLFLRHTTFPSTASIVIKGVAGGRSGYVMTAAEFSNFVSAVVDKLKARVSTLGAPESLRSLAVRDRASENSDLVIRGWTAGHPVDTDSEIRCKHPLNILWYGLYSPPSPLPVSEARFLIASILPLSRLQPRH